MTDKILLQEYWLSKAECQGDNMAYNSKIYVLDKYLENRARNTAPVVEV